MVVDGVELGSGSCRHRCEDASCRHIIFLICALVVSINIHLDVCGEFFDLELFIITEQVVGLRAHRDFSDGSGAKSPSRLVAPLGETCSNLEDLSSSVIKLI